MGHKNTIIAIILGSIILVADYVSKQWAIQALMMQDIDILPFFNLSLAYNTGVSFSLFKTLHPSVLIVLAGIVSIVIAWILWQHENHWVGLHPRWMAGIIVGAALGNVHDRIRYGYVIDFIDLHVGGYHWPTFNIADTGLSLVMCWLVVSMIRSK